MITTETSGVWDADDIYKKINAGYLGYTGVNGLFSWGNNSSGELGQNNRTNYSSPVQIPGTNWSFVDSAGGHSLGLKSDGTLWAWGSNSGGELGQGNRTQYSSPIQIPGNQWSSVSGSASHSLSLKTDGTLWAWGVNSNGQLAQNNRTQYSSPVQIPGTTWATGDIKISIGSQTVFAIKNNVQ